MSERAERMWNQFQLWWQNQSRVSRWALWCLLICTVLGFALRFTNLGSSLQFQADQGRDALVAYGILRFDVALLGPSTSVGSMYLGPLYYYFMAPFIGLFGNSPVGPAVAVAFLGVITIPVLFWVVQNWFGKTVAAWTVLLYTAAPWVLEYTRFSWNPNPAPLVSLIFWWSSWKALRENPRWWWVAGLFAAILIQLHYVALLAIVPVGLWWLWQVSSQVRLKQWPALRKQLLWTVVAFGIVLASFAPLVLFDLRFNGLIRAGFAEYLQGSSEEAIPTGERLWLILNGQEGRAIYTFGEFWGGENTFPEYRDTVRVILGIMLVSWIFWGLRLRQVSRGAEWLYITSIIWTTILGLAWYRGVVFAHYLTYFYPIVTLFFAGGMAELVHRGKIGRVVAGAIFTICFLGIMAPGSYDFIKPAGWKYTDMKMISDYIIEQVPDDKTYSLTLLSEIRDYRGLNYRYFLITSDRPPVPLEVSHEADYLVIIAESPEDPTQVLGSPVYEIVTFPRGEYTILQPPLGPKIYVIENSQKVPQVSDESGT